MTFKMELAEIIPTLVEAMLPRFSVGNKLLYLNLVVRVSEDLASDGIARHIHLLFHRPGSYTTVMLAVTDNPRLRKEEIKDWLVTSCHDSCWKADGVGTPLFQLYVKMCKVVNPTDKPGDMVEEARLIQAPKVLEVKSFVHDRDNFRASITW